MQITHEQARMLIQFNADEALKGTEKTLLEDHLESCLECRIYAGKVEEVEFILESAMQRMWNRHPLPLHMNTVAPRKYSKLTQNLILATRIAAMGVICIAFLFNILQFTLSAERRTNPSMIVPAVPTPSLFSTSTKVKEQDCEHIIYRVQENDTLESIAIRYSIPVEEIRALNNMERKTLYPSMNLWIPLCNPTPQGTPNTVTAAITPLLGPTTSTPLNSPTQ